MREDFRTTLDVLLARRGRLAIELADIDALASFSDSVLALPDLTHQGDAAKWIRTIACLQSAVAMLGEHYSESDYGPTRAGQLCEDCMASLSTLLDASLYAARISEFDLAAEHERGAADERAAIAEACHMASVNYGQNAASSDHHWSSAFYTASLAIAKGERSW